MTPRSITDLFIVIADPQRDGRPPVAVPGDGPVSCVPQPVAETLLFHKLRNPGYKTEAKDESHKFQPGRILGDHFKIVFVFLNLLFIVMCLDYSVIY